VKTRSLVVASREFRATVRSPGFLVTTFGMPLFGLLIAALSALPGVYLAAKTSARQKGAFALVDEAGVVAKEASRPPAGPPQAPVGAGSEIERLIEELRDGGGRAPTAAPPLAVERYLDLAAAEEALKARRVRGVIVIPKDYLATGRIDLYEDAREGELTSAPHPGAGLRTLLVDGLLLGQHVDPAVLARAKQPIASERRFRLGQDGTFRERDELAELGKLAVPVAMMVFLLLAIFTSAGYLMQGVAEEKENRVLEVILSSVTARELLTGKLLGLGAAGLVQLAIWSGGVLAPAARLFPFVQVQPGIVAIAVAQFVLGYLLFGSLVLGFGSLGGNYRESQQWSAAFSIVGGAIPPLFLPIILDDPGGTFARVLSVVPPTAPICMTVRAALGPVPWPDLALSFVATAAAAAIAVRVAARVYRAGTLMTGKKPSLAEVWRVLRTAEK
jgi:ABC-2 type transport system permease protein